MGMKTGYEVSQLILEMEQQSDDGHRFNKIVTYFKIILQNLERTYDGAFGV